MARRKGVCDSFCKGCWYNQYASGDSSTLCTYFLETGVRRPCPAGTGCTVKKTGRRLGKWQQEKDETWAKRMLEAKKAKAVLRKDNCKLCGTEFETYNPRQIFCCKRCANRQRQRNMHQRRKECENGKEKRFSSKTESIAAGVL